MTPQEARDVIGLIVAFYPHPAPSAETQRLWARAIEDLPGRLTREAVAAWCRTRSERPTVADLRRAVATRLLGLPDPTEAWARLLEAVQSRGRYAGPPQEPPLLHRAARALGWESLCAADVGAIAVYRAQFLRLYGSLLDRELAAAAARDGAGAACDGQVRPAIAPARVLLRREPRPVPARPARLREVLAQALGGALPGRQALQAQKNPR